MRQFGFSPLFVLALSVTALTAQETPTAATEGRSLCFRGQPLPACSAFWITEVGYVRRFAVFGHGERHYPNWELGLMVNSGAKSAIGGTLYAGVLNGFRWGIKARYRRWLNSITSIDISPGILLGAGDKNTRASWGMSV